MAQVNAGRVRFIGRGAYDNSTQYYTFDLVNYNGNSYFAKSNTMGNLPTNSTYWQLVAEKGNLGPEGPTGNGIDHIELTNTSGGVKTYTIYYTDGNTYDYNVTDGEVTKEELQEEVDRLSMVYNALPSQEATGENITIDGTAEVPFRKIELKGNMSQDTTTGKNLFDVNVIQERTVNGITMTFEGQQIKISGTTTGNANFYFKNNKDFILPAGTYFITRSKLSPATMSIFSNGELIVAQGNSDISFTLNNDTVINGLTLQIPSSVGTIDKYLTIQLETGSTATDYEPYTNGASPNPDYPQDIHVVSGDNEIKVEGKNLFDKDNATTVQSYISSTGVYKTSTNNVMTIIFPTSPNKTYTVSKITGTTFRLAYSNNLPSNSDTLLGLVDATTSTNATITVGSEAKYLLLYVYSANETMGIETMINSIQIEKGTQATTYEPYQSASYPVSLGDIELCKIGDYQDFIKASTGKNLFNKNNVTNWNGYVNANHNKTYTNADRKSIVWLCKPNTTYTISKVLSSHFRVGVSSGQPSNNMTLLSSIENDSGTSITITTGDNAQYLIIAYYWEDDTLTQQQILDSIMINEGSTALPYEPYGKGFYLTKNIGKVVLDGSESWYGWGVTGARGLALDLEGLSYSSGTQMVDGYSSHFIPDGRTNVYNNVNDNRFAYNGATLWIRHNSSATLADFKTWLSTHNTTVYYILATPIYTEITDLTLINQLNNLEKANSYDGQTNISQTNNDMPFTITSEAILSLKNILNI